MMCGNNDSRGILHHKWRWCEHRCKKNDDQDNINDDDDINAPQNLLWGFRVFAEVDQLVDQEAQSPQPDGHDDDYDHNDDDENKYGDVK